jgi:type VI secretion system secreted protein Hcp
MPAAKIKPAKERVMPIFLKYDGINGDVTTTGHEKWIEVLSLQWGTGRGITNAGASGADREGSTPSVSEIVVTKDTDSASPNLLRASLGLGPAAEGKKVNIDFCKTDTSKPEPYLQLTLENCLVSAYSLDSRGDRPSESVSLNFTKVEFKNTAMGKANETGSPDTANYDLTTQTGS